jgi:CRP-like cAMP-binding protein
MKLVRNRLVQALPAAERRRLTRDLEMVDMERNTTIAEAGQSVRQVYFPETAMVSVVSSTRDGLTVEVGVIGRSGTTGIPVFLASEENALDSFVQIPGRAGRISAERFRDYAAPGTALAELSLRYTNFFLQQIARAAACNVLHRLEQRCARWLLLASEEVGSREFSLTHEFLSEMLGVRRASVTDVAAEFSERELMKYRRGRVKIVDPKGLEQASCECFRDIFDERDRVFRESRPGARRRRVSSPRGRNAGSSPAALRRDGSTDRSGSRR